MSLGVDVGTDCCIDHAFNLTEKWGPGVGVLTPASNLDEEQGHHGLPSHQTFQNLVKLRMLFKEVHRGLKQERLQYLGAKSLRATFFFFLFSRHFLFLSFFSQKEHSGSEIPRIHPTNQALRIVTQKQPRVKRN